MKKMAFRCLLTGIVCLTHFFAAAQTAETVRVNAGEDIAAAISPNGIFRFPAFIQGSIVLKNGNHGDQLLNYNILSGQIMYIDKKGDTLAIGIPDQVEKIIIKDTAFYYYKNECVEEIAGSPGVSLVKERKISINYQKKGAFGNTDAVGAGIDNVTNLQTADASYKFSVNQDAVVRKMTNYFLLTAGGEQLPVTKSNFLSLFPKNKDKIEAWIKDHKTNFNRAPDLMELFNTAIASS